MIDKTYPVVFRTTGIGIYRPESTPQAGSGLKDPARSEIQKETQEEQSMGTFKITLCQQSVRDRVEDNLKAAADAVRAAAAEGADLVVLPEMFVCHFVPLEMSKYAQTMSGSYMEALSRMAAENRVWLVGGSFPEKSTIEEEESCGGDAKTEREVLYNTCPVFSPGGTLAGVYRKRYLFDVDIPGKVRTCEAVAFEPGKGGSLIVDTGFAKVGVAVCFDIRFPNLFINMAAAGADVIVVPAAFSAWTGPAHWELLNRARAVDAQVYVAGTDVAYREDAPFVSHGCSCICDPWGNVVEQAGKEETMISAQIDTEVTEKMRRNLIVLKHQPVTENVPVAAAVEPAAVPKA